MDSNKLSVVDYPPFTPPPADRGCPPAPSLAVETREEDAIELYRQLYALLGRQKSLDEHSAKRLRKSWGVLSPTLGEDSTLRPKLEKGFEELRNRIHQQVETRHAEFAKLEQHLESLQKSVAGNDLQASQVLEQQIIRGLNHIPGLSFQRRQQILDVLESLQPKIKQLDSWRNWGTDQAREQMIEEIKQIHEKETDLPTIAKRIQQAREEWKKWDLSCDRGNHRLYTVFDAACTAAYAPCQVHFDHQREQRQEAGQKRVRICERLETAFAQIDWNQPDWKSVQKLVREQTGQWHALRAADYRDRKILAKRFETIIRQFDEPLDRERRINLRFRKDLIKKIETLRTYEDPRKAVSELQPLKKEWRVTVSSKRGIEQEVWKQFTKACDAIYHRDQESKKSLRNQLALQLEQKQTLCAEIESWIAQSSQDPDEGAACLRRWKTMWDQLGSVFKRREPEIEKRFRHAMAAARQYLSGLRQARRLALNDHLFQKAAICIQLETAILQGIMPDIPALQSTFEAVPSLDTALQAALESRFHTAVGAVQHDMARQQFMASLDTNYDRINSDLLQLEINAGVESPVIYAKQRMALQIGRLSAALGKTTDHEVLDNQALIERIHTTGPVPESQQQDLAQRFQTSYQALIAATHSVDPAQ